MTARARRAAAPAIDYDELYERYLRSLVDTLRGFSSGIEGLEHWVPSEDPLLSLTHLLEAAAAEGRSELRVRFGKQSSPRLDPVAVERLIAEMGEGQVRARRGQLVVEVKQLRVRAAATPEVVAPTPRRVRAPDAPASAAGPRAASLAPYAAALAAAGERVSQEGVLPEPMPADAVRVEGVWRGVRLLVEVDRADHVVRAARFCGDFNRDERALLDVFCSLVRGRPLLEAAQHGAILLEHHLRDRALPPPVTGVITPAAAHPMFELPTRLIRAALASYRARSGYQEVDNRHDAPLAESWLKASPTQRLAQLELPLRRCRAQLDLQEPQLQVQAVEHDVRVVLALDPQLPAAQQRRVLLACEQALQEAIDPRLEVYAEERKDRNKLRRLAVVEGA
jgi:hypothetical protein